MNGFSSWKGWKIPDKNQYCLCQFKTTNKVSSFVFIAKDFYILIKFNINIKYIDIKIKSQWFDIEFFQHFSAILENRQAVFAKMWFIFDWIFRWFYLDDFNDHCLCYSKNDNIIHRLKGYYFCIHFIDHLNNNFINHSYNGYEN